MCYKVLCFLNKDSPRTNSQTVPTYNLMQIQKDIVKLSPL